MSAPHLKKLAVAVDGSANGETALEWAIDLAQRYSAEITIIAVAPIIPVYINSTEPFVPAGVPPSQVDQYRQITEAAVKKVQAAGVKGVTGVTYEGVVIDEILNYLDHHTTDLVVMGSRGLSTGKRILLGSVSTGVVTHAHCPVLVVHPSATK